jgi:glucoside 3-dehydrogenase (cytochrome c) hitch-hiker subunit
MDRRNALKLLAGAASIPLLSREAFSLFQSVHDQLPATPALKALDPHQDAIVTTIAEMIIPQTDTPGAKAARVNEFIDVIVAYWYNPDEKSAFLSGLDDVDARSRNLFGKDFVDCPPPQQQLLLQALEDEVPEIRAERGAPWEQKFVKDRHFFYMIKQLTLMGYYTSQIGFEQELHLHLIPPRHAGCAPFEEGSN